MVGIAVISHGGLCEGILDSIGMVAGSMQQTKCLSLKPGNSPDMYKEKLYELVKSLDSGQGVMVFTDILGGTPFHTICALSAELQVQIITGMNMPMLIAMAFERTEDSTLDEVAEMARIAGEEGIRMMKRQGGI